MWRTPFAQMSLFSSQKKKKNLQNQPMRFAQSSTSVRDANIYQTRSAPSPVWSPSVAVSWPAVSSRPRCTVPSSSAVNTSTTSPSTTVTRRGTRTLLLTSLPLSVLRRVTGLPLASAVLSARLYVESIPLSYHVTRHVIANLGYWQKMLIRFLFFFLGPLQRPPCLAPYR